MLQNFDRSFVLPNGKPIFVQSPIEIPHARHLMRRILRNWRPDLRNFHFRKGGHIAAAKAHLLNSYFCVLDLEDFFGSVRRNRIDRTLKKLGFSRNDALDFARRSTVATKNLPVHFVLPFGFVQSMLLASLAVEKSIAGKK